MAIPNLYFNALLKSFGITTNSILEIALTHNSYNATKNNSRYVFLGMYALKGEIANYVFRHIGGTGTQLQQFYGNCTSQKYLQVLFDKLDLQKHIKIAPSIKIAEQYHIMVWGLMGYIFSKCFEEDKQSLVYKYFIEPNESQLPQTFKPKNEWEQLKLLVKQQFNSYPKLVHTELDGKQQIELFYNNNLASNASSISYKYAKKKAITQALKIIVAQSDAALIGNPVHESILLAATEKKTIAYNKLKEARKEKYAIKLEKKQHDKLLKKQEANLKTIAEDKKRRNLKMKPVDKTNRKGKDTIYRSYTAEEIAAMSNSKRRNLQDKGIIPKGM